MPRPPGILLDCLAPRIFRNLTVPRGAWKSWNLDKGAIRQSSSVALLKEWDADCEDTGRRYQSTEGSRGRERYEGESLAGPSRLKGMTEGLGMERCAGVRRRGKTCLSPSPFPAHEGKRESAGSSRTSGQSRLGRKEDSNVASPVDISGRSKTSSVSAGSIDSPSRKLPAYRESSDRSLMSHFRKPNPPDPTDLLRTHPLTRTSGDLLLRYAERLGDHRSEHEIRDKMARMRLAPVRYMDPRQRGRRRLLCPKQNSQDRGSPKDVRREEIMDNGEMKRVRPPISPGLKELRARSSIWARRMWPPLPDLPTFRDPTPQDFLRYQHHLLIYVSSPPSFVDVLDSLSNIKGVKDRHLRELLHLFLVYTPYRPENTKTSRPGVLPGSHPNNPVSFSPLHPMLNHFLVVHPHILPTRQTLHLLVRSILSSPSASLPQSLKSAHVQSLLAVFRIQWRIKPGCETWRHLMKFALVVEDKQWGREIWDGWWEARERSMRISVKGKMERRPLYTGQWTPEGQHAKATGGIKDDTGQGGKEDEEDDELGNEEEVIFRFRHLGTHLSRWIRVIKQLEDRGWIKRRLEPQDKTRPHSKAGWIWIDEAERV